MVVEAGLFGCGYAALGIHEAIWILKHTSLGVEQE